MEASPQVLLDSPSVGNMAVVIAKYQAAGLRSPGILFKRLPHRDNEWYNQSGQVKFVNGEPC